MYLKERHSLDPWDVRITKFVQTITLSSDDIERLVIPVIGRCLGLHSKIIRARTTASGVDLSRIQFRPESSYYLNGKCVLVRNGLHTEPALFTDVGQIEAL